MGTASSLIYFWVPRPVESSTISAYPFSFSGQNEASGGKADEPRLVGTNSDIDSGWPDTCSSAKGWNRGKAGRYLRTRTTCGQPRQANRLHSRNPHPCGLPSIRNWVSGGVAFS